MIDDIVSSNGAFMLINRNGIAITNTGITDTASFLATTGDIKFASEKDFFSTTNYRFSVSGASGAEISNAGTINVAQGGLAALVAPSVRNEGTISAKLGRIELGGARVLQRVFMATVCSATPCPPAQPATLQKIAAHWSPMAVWFVCKLVRLAAW